VDAEFWRIHSASAKDIAMDYEIGVGDASHNFFFWAKLGGEVNAEFWQIQLRRALLPGVQVLRRFFAALRMT
jgi:hypothetical protein